VSKTGRGGSSSTRFPVMSMNMIIQLKPQGIGNSCHHLVLIAQLKLKMQTGCQRNGNTTKLLDVSYQQYKQRPVNFKSPLQLQILTLSSLLTAFVRVLGLDGVAERLSVVYVFTSV